MMEDGVLSSDTMLGVPADSAMDFDFMDELFFEGFWLETTDGSEYLNPNPSFPATFYDPSFVWPNLEPKAGPSHNSNEENKCIPWLPGNSPLNELHGVGHVNAQSVGENTASVPGYGNNAAEGSEVGRRWWVGPTGNPDPAASVKTRLVRALEHIQALTKDEDILIQLWVPVNRGGKRVLTTDNQPFALGTSSQKLASYRNVSVQYQFPVEEDSKGFLGLPGRVFLGKVPEWSPDVRFFRSDEYPRVIHAQQYDVRGTLALPVFEQGSRTCLGVVEVVMTTQKSQYRPELETVCRALEAVDLRGSDISGTRAVEVIQENACDASYKAALPEILEVLRSACETHRLPLGQTWVPCIQQGKGGCRHSDENYSRCVSTVDHACYVADHRIQPFHEACSDHHLLKGQGLVGGAFVTNQPCFHTDITSFCKTEYPLSHHARMFGLHAAVAIRLRSTQTGSTDFVLEFFLPVECKDPEEQKKMLTSLSTVIQQVCRTLRVVTDEELEEESSFLVSEVVVSADGAAGKVEPLKVKDSPSERCARDDSSWTACEVQESGKDVSLLGKEHKKLMSSKKSMDSRKIQEDSNLNGSFESVLMSKTVERRRTKADKGITLEVLRQYFAGSLKDAAKSIGVCPTTLKRICRQHGIMRWPSRKIKKVGHSLQKLQLVIDSVQGASGTLQVDSFYRNYPELETSNLSSTKTSDDLKPPHLQPDGSSVAISYAGAPKSPSSSCGQSSSSSHSCSSGTQQNPPMFTSAANKDPLAGENRDRASLKRVRSSSELLDSGLVEEKLLPRSQSLIPLREVSSFSNLPPLPKTNSQLSEEMNFQRVKISYGTENIRLRMPYSWRYEDLLHETGRRFNIDDISRFDLKYLDDDCEWVLLRCDDDLKECVEICQSSGSHTVKLSLQVSHLLARGLFGSL